MDIDDIYIVKYLVDNFAFKYSHYQCMSDAEEGIYNYVGKKFVEDTEFVESTIQVLWLSPAEIEPFHFYIEGKKVIGQQVAGWIGTSFNQSLSKKLVNELICGKSEQFILGYVSKYLPKINEEVLRQRYTSGHLLIRTFSTLDIKQISVTVPTMVPRPIVFSGPQGVPSFPPSKKLAASKDEIYIRDFIDAINSYLGGNYDDCIRKAMTSVENAFRKYNFHSRRVNYRLPLSFLFKKKKFIEIIENKILSEDIARKTIAGNLIFFYKLRNKIVHHKFRIRPENGWVAKKAIGTLVYLYQLLGRDQDTVDYICSLSQQFLLIDDYIRGQDLDGIKKMNNPQRDTSNDVLIESDDDLPKLDEFMFNGLSVSKTEQSIVLNNKIPPGYYN